MDAYPSGPTLAVFGLGWLARGQLSTPADVAVYPQQVPATTVDDHGNQITAITAAKRGALAVTYTRADGLTVQAVTAHLWRGSRASPPTPGPLADMERPLTIGPVIARFNL